MGAVAWAGVLSSGHGPYFPQVSSGGEPSVLVDGKPIHVAGDIYSIHSNPSPSPNPHTGKLLFGSSTVKAGGKGIGRLGDSIDCGSVCAQGLPNVLAGG